MDFSRPFGTWSIRTPLPTLKRWAIVVRSLRDSSSIGYNHAPVIAMARKSRYNVVTLMSRTPALRANTRWLDRLRLYLYLAL